MVKFQSVCLATFLAALLSCPVQATVVFDFGISPSDGPGSGGFFDTTTPDGLANAEALAETGEFLGSLLGHTATIEIDVTTFSDAGDSTLASAGGFFYVDPSAMGVVPNAVQEEILFGAVTPGSVDGFMMINTAKSFYNGSDPAGIGAGEKDLRSVFLHELTHALGWASAVKSDGTSGLTDALIASDPGTFAGLDELFTIYDTFLIDTFDAALIDLGTEDFDAGTLPLGGVLFAGPEAFAAAGGAIPLIVTPFALDATHIPSALPLDTVMNPSLADGAIKRIYSPSDLGVLKDLGYIIVPEPASATLFMVASVLLMSRLPRCRVQG